MVWRSFSRGHDSADAPSSSSSSFFQFDPQDFDGDEGRTPVQVYGEENANETTALLGRPGQHDDFPQPDSAAVDTEYSEDPEDPHTPLLPADALFLPPSLVEKESVFSAPAGIIGAKSTGGNVSNYVRGLAMQRIPKTQVSAGTIFVAFTFLCMNVVAFFFGYGTDNGAKAGDLVAANSLLVAVMATRNSVLVSLLDIPFDRMIMFHRWLGLLHPVGQLHSLRA